MKQDFELIYSKARLAGLESGERTRPIPMGVQQHKNMADDNSPVVKSWVVEGGVCGFAWVNVRPGTSSFAKWLVKNGHARRDSYYGGVSIWVSDFGQSMQRKEAFAYAFAKVLNDAGIEASASSRMD